MSLVEIFSIIIIHFVADFILQDEKWALGKSKNWKDLLTHTFVYSMIWWIPILIMALSHQSSNELIDETMNKGALFILITFIAHTITDYFTSRIVSKKFAEGKYGSAIPNFGAFTLIGGDQVLHYIQLFATYYYLIKI
jgi:hypothetical protein